MKQVIYADVLVGVNLFINYFTLLGTSRCLYIKYKRLRIFLGALLGAFYSLYIFFPKINLFLSLLIKVLMVITIIWVTFGDENRKLKIKAGIYFYGINLIFCGMMFALWILFSPNGLIINNSIVYFNISPIILLISTVISYALIQLFSRLINKKNVKDIFCRVKVEISGKNTVFDGKIDTGNTLREPFSNLPVIVVKENELNGIVPQEVTNFLRVGNDNKDYRVSDIWKKRLRMVPFKTISGEGILPAFKPDNLEIEGINKKAKKEAYIAVCKEETFKEEFAALVSSDLID